MFLDNFLVQWHPESLLTKEISPSCPRVYLIDFEVAVEFSADCLQEQRVVAGFPCSGSLMDPEEYMRTYPHEAKTGELYCPFKTDVWQLGTSILYFRVRQSDPILWKGHTNSC